MGNVAIERLGEIGIVRDMPYHEIPPNAWSAGVNVRMDKNEVVSFLGNEVRATDPTGSVNDFIIELSGVSTEVAHYWFYARSDDVLGTTSFFAFDGATYHDITPAAGAITGLPSDIMIGALLNQNIVVCNNVDQPYSWDLVPANPMTLLPGWDALWTSLGIHAHKGFLIAYNMVEAGVQLSHRVRWSDVAQSGLPQSWDAADPTKLAGFTDLGDSTSALIYAQHLRDTVYIYSNNQIFGMQFIGGQFVWRFYTVTLEAGLLAPRCAVNVRNNLQVAVSDGDVLIIDGQSVRSIINRRNRSWMFSQLDPDNFGKTFAFTHLPENEVWICFPQIGSVYPDLALVWNYLSDTWYQREMPANTMALGSALDIGPTNMVTRVRPRMSGTAPVDIYVGGQMAANGPVSFQGPFPFKPGIDEYITCRVNGRSHSIRYETTGNSAWRLAAHEIEWRERGMF